MKVVLLLLLLLLVMMMVAIGEGRTPRIVVCQSVCIHYT